MRFRELLRNFLLVLGPLLLVLLAVFFWNRSLRTQVLLRTKELRESERRYRLLSENTIDVIWVVTPQLRIRYVNPAVRHLTGYEPKEIIGTGLRAYLEPEDVRKIVSSARSTLDGDYRERSFSVETRFGLKAGGTVEVEIAGKPLYAPDGALAGFQGVARDITDRKQYEETLTKTMQCKEWLTTIATAYLATGDAEELVRSAIDQLGTHFNQLDALCFRLEPDGVLCEEYRCATSDGGADEWSPIRLTESPDLLRAIEQPTTTAIRDIEADPITQGLAAGFSASGIAAIALVPLIVDGYPRRVLALTADRPVRWSRHELLSLEEHANLLRLILDNEKYQRMMDEAKQSLETSLKEKQTLLQEVHHRVKNNLNVVVSLLHLQESAIENVEQARLAFEESRNRIYSMALVHESLYQSENLSEIEMSDYLRELTRKLTDGLRGDNPVELQFDTEPLFMDISRAVPCGIIVNELVTNAIKHGFLDQPHPKIVVSLRNTPEAVEVSVSDNGSGMPKALTQGDRSTLGMTLVEVLAEQIDGKIGFESDGGTRATLRIPQR